jgi:hypothetical protein
MFAGCVPLPHVKRIVSAPNDNTLAVSAKTYGKDFVIRLKLMGDALLQVPQPHHPIGTPTVEMFPIWTEGQSPDEAFVGIELVSQRAIELP